MNNAYFGKNMENVRKHRDMKLVTTKPRRNYLGPEPNYHIKFFFQKFISYRNGNNMIYCFELKEGKLKKLKISQSICMIKRNILY